MKTAAARSRREIPRRTVVATAADRVSRATSRTRQPPLADTRDGLNAREPGAKRLFAHGGELVRIAAIVGVESVDQAPRLETGDGGVQRARSEANIRERGDFLRHGVAVLRALGEADQNQEGWFAEPPEFLEVDGLIAPVHAPLHVIRLAEYYVKRSRESSAGPPEGGHHWRSLARLMR